MTARSAKTYSKIAAKNPIGGNEVQSIESYPSSANKRQILAKLADATAERGEIIHEPNLIKPDQFLQTAPEG